MTRTFTSLLVRFNKGNLLPSKREKITNDDWVLVPSIGRLLTQEKSDPIKYKEIDTTRQINKSILRSKKLLVYS